MIHILLRLRRLLFFCLITFFCLLARAQEHQPIYQGFSGGMFLHSGYISGPSFPVYQSDGTFLRDYRIQGAPLGIGGTIRFHLGSHWRVGCEGYGTKTHYGDDGSWFKIGWGGVLADFRWSFGRFTPYIGTTIGGGKASHLILTQTNPNSFEVQEGPIYREYPIVLINPFIGLEYLMTTKLSLVLKVDGMLRIAEGPPDFATGPRVYLGVIFNRLGNQAH